jgi:hypothetical protein
MAVSLANLISRLQVNIPAKGDTPSAAQYDQAVKDAVLDFSSRCPLKKLATITVVSGTAVYDLPADFTRLIKVESLLSPEGGVLVTDAGLIPVSASYEERFTVGGGKVTFYPTPTYTTARYVWYAAGYVFDDDNVYPDMTEAEARVIILKAQAMALHLLANVNAGGWSYKIGDEAVDKKNVGQGYRDQAKALDGDYLAAVGQMVGPVGMRADY